MKTESIPTIFEIQVEELSTWAKRPHRHNFFEIVYIEKGAGFQCVNEHEFGYQEGHIFLLPPLDCHSFRITHTTKFYFIRFTDHYFLKGDPLTDYQGWFDRVAYVLANYNKVPGDIISSERERQFIINSIKTIHQEYLLADSYSSSITTSIVASILNILARSIERIYVGQANELDNRFGEILRYINKNLLENEKIRIPELASRFNISKSYFSEYFKKQTGVSLAEYLLKSKLRIVETKILHTDLSIKEIAHQTGFTDSSHLSKSFKKVPYGVTITAFRNHSYSNC